MTAAIQIDTLAFAKKLKEAGADERLADAIVEGITAADTSNLATKEDLRIETAILKEEIADVRSEIADVRSEIAAVRSDLKEEISGVRSELKEDIGNVRSDLAMILGEMKQGQLNQLRWTIGLAVGMLAALMGTLAALI